MKRFAIVDGPGIIETVRNYLPRNYTATLEGKDIVISGEDDHGWTLDGYVIPRLASGLIVAREIESIPTATEVILADAVEIIERVSRRLWDHPQDINLFADCENFLAKHRKSS